MMITSAFFHQTRDWSNAALCTPGCHRITEGPESFPMRCSQAFQLFGHSLTIEIVLAIREDGVKNSEEDLAGGSNCIECCDLLLQHWQEQGWCLLL